MFGAISQPIHGYWFLWMTRRNFMINFFFFSGCLAAWVILQTWTPSMSLSGVCFSGLTLGIKAATNLLSFTHTHSTNRWGENAVWKRFTVTSQPIIFQLQQMHEEKQALSLVFPREAIQRWTCLKYRFFFFLNFTGDKQHSSKPNQNWCKVLTDLLCCSCDLTLTVPLLNINRPSPY